MPLPTVAFMHPTLVPRPIHHEGWVYEEKVDGYRMGAYKNGTTVRLVSRRGKDHTTRFPELASALSKLDTSPSLVLDGEVAVYDKQLISRFEWLRHQAPLELATPPLFMAFDCLYARGKDLRTRPLYVRRNVVEDVLDRQDLVLPVRRLAEDGLAGRARARLRGAGGEGPAVALPRRPHAVLAQGEAARLPRPGARLAPLGHIHRSSRAAYTATIRITTAPAARAI